jgi:hypothetical protein
MARRNKADFQPAVPSWQDDPPAGATRKAFEREDNGGGPPGTPLAEQPDVDGDTETANLVEEAAQLEEEPAPEEENEAYGGPTGGAVGGTPAGGRSTGGNIHRGLAPGESHRGDSTIGADPRTE